MDILAILTGRKSKLLGCGMFCLFILSSCSYSNDSPRGLSPDNTLAFLERFERTLPIAVEAANTFDPNEATVDVELIGPDVQRTTIPAFLCEGFTRIESSNGSELLRADGLREWHFRFTPIHTGDWHWRSLRVTVAGEEAGDWEDFNVRPNADPERHGFLRIPDGAKASRV